MKRRKLTSKLEKLFKGLNKRYRFDEELYLPDEVSKFSQKYNVNFGFGIGCFKVTDLKAGYIYLVSWDKGRLMVESKDLKDFL